MLVEMDSLTVSVAQSLRERRSAGVRDQREIDRHTAAFNGIEQREQRLVVPPAVVVANKEGDGRGTAVEARANRIKPVGHRDATMAKSPRRCCCRRAVLVRPPGGTRARAVAAKARPPEWGPWGDRRTDRGRSPADGRLVRR